MFANCASLTTPPALPATTLAENCYQGMFSCCTLLERLPALPALILTPRCYYVMFAECSSLVIDTGPTPEGYSFRIPTSGTGTIANDALTGMFSNTAIPIVTTPVINRTYYVQYAPIE